MVPTASLEGLQLESERLGALPLLNHFLDRLGVEPLLDRFVPSTRVRSSVSHACALGVLLRSIVLEREPIYRQQETVARYAPGLFGLKRNEVDELSDDRIGRALDRLFDADRSALLTEIVVKAADEFALKFDQLHNDSTTVKLSGQYRAAKGRSIRGKSAPWITCGHSKDHRPDLKQLLLVLTTTKDGGVPVQFRCESGNESDSRTHIETWEKLRELAGRSDFLYVADSKLCSRENLDYIHEHGGRLVTVLPRSRLEDSEFRTWIHTHDPDWELVWDRPNPRRKYGPRDRWWVFRYPIPSREAWPVIWVKSSLVALRDEAKRRENLAGAVEELGVLKERLSSPRNRLKRVEEIDKKVGDILGRYRVKPYIEVRRVVREDEEFRQTRPGRPGAETDYRRVTKRKNDIEWEVDEGAIERDRKSDGMYPLLTNDRKLSAREVLEAHKGQPKIEKRFQQTKSVHEIAPVFLKNEGRIEALFFLYFVALLVQSLIEREARVAMRREGLHELPIYPEERPSHSPTTEQILRLFSHVRRSMLLEHGSTVRVFDDPLTDLQRTLLRLLGVPESAYHSAG